MPTKKPKESKERRPARKFRFSFLPSLDGEQKKKVVKVTGLAVATFAIFTLIAIVSYLFTWKADQSLLSDPFMMDGEAEVHNSAGKLGYRWGHFLVCRCFGLGSFAFVILLGVIAARLLFGQRRMGVVKAFVVTVSGAVAVSVLLAFIAQFSGGELAFGGGLGGDCGAAIVSWSANLVGNIVTGVLILILVLAWLLFSSRRFSSWMLSAFDRPAAAREGENGESKESVLPAEGSSGTNAEGDSAGAGTDDAGAEERRPDAAGTGDMEDRRRTAEDADMADDSDVSGRDLAEGDSVGKAGFEGHDGNAMSEGISAVPGSKGVKTSPFASGRGVAESVSDVTEKSDPAQLEVIKGEMATEVRKELPRIDNREELENYRFPSLDLLSDYPDGRHEVANEELERNNNKIRATLLSYKIQVEKVSACVGPTVTLYKIVPAKGVKISAIRNLEEDIALSLGAKGVRVVTLEDAVGIEVANDRPSIVPLKFMLNDDAFRNTKYELPVAIGATITNKVKVFDLADSPHLLIAGATKQGKSVGLNVIITSLLYSKHPSELKFVFIDPKMVEFTLYSKLIRHYLAVLPKAVSEQDEMDNAIVKQPKHAEEILRSLCLEMDERYHLISKAEVRNIKEYNNKYRDRYLLPTEGHRFLPYIVVVIDEYADLIMTGSTGGESKTIARSVTTSIIRLAQKGRAAGIHVIIATQRPSVDVITGLIKTNFPTRIAFRVVTRTDSGTILDSPGAEKLIGRGDMLYYAGVEMERMQCAFVDKEIKQITEFIGSQTGYRQAYSTPYYLPVPQSEDGDAPSGDLVDMQNLDPLFEDAARLVVLNQIGSTSTLQRKLGMGYARAGRVMDQLESAGIVGPQEGSKPRQVLVPDYDTLDPILKAFQKTE
ncbi:MAG: DNA translocase FtsK 4TM domain-containing protein [Bacteroidetes bacterium]|uniref:DNA translocase FtsK 4TM domain-containing protein n=1 Tax=Candidatus Cryptobacteroides merdavium TaxID=2840769 RepID=A0A9D9EDU6_9BACT|nr:DNA translocase FtsK 4TM domain-containing protein [Candidatus Cryptobacteroides merdavium]